MPTRKKTAGQQKTGRKRTTTARNVNGRGNNGNAKRTSEANGKKKQNMRNQEETQEE